MLLKERLDRIVPKPCGLSTGLLAGFCLWFSSTFAKTPPVQFERFSVKDGLSSNNVRSIIQDRHGYMWFGTYGGINRFDGYSFKTYQYDLRDTTTLGGNHVIGLWEAPDGIIWAAISNGGLARLDPRTDRVQRYKAARHQPGRLHTNDITAVRGDRQGNLWVGTIEGLCHFDPKTERFTRYQHNPADPASISTNSMVSAIQEDQDGNVWIGTVDGGINRVNINYSQPGQPPKVTFTRYQHNLTDPTSISSNQVMALGEDRSGALWVGTRAGLSRFDKRRGRCTAHFQHDLTDSTSLSNNQISRYGISEDKQGNLWVGTINGLNQLNPERSRFTRFYYNSQDLTSVASNTIHTVYTDRTGILWTGTNDAGINRFDPNRQQIPLFSHQPGSAVTLNGYNIRSICGDTLGHLWIGTEGGGLFRFQLKTGQLKSYRESQLPAGLTTNFIGVLLADRKGYIWVGPGSDWTSSKGSLSRLNPATGRMQHIDLLQNGKTYSFVLSMLEDRRGTIWLGAGFGGLIRFDFTRNKTTHYRYDPDNPRELSEKWVRALAEDQAGDIWIGTGYGLNCLNPRTGRFQHFFNDSKDATSLAHNEIYSLCVTRTGQLWIGTDGGGLCLFHPATQKFTTFIEKDGLPGNIIYNILEDDDSNLWLNTNRGLCRFSPRSRQFTNFNLDNEEENYLVSGNVSTGACYKADDGTLFFGGKNGFIQFHPHSLRFNPTKPPIVLTGLRLFDKLLPGSYNQQKLTLNHDQNSLTFDFAALNYTSSAKNQYAYQLENFTNGWVYAGTRRTATFTNLDPGTYTFRVKGANNDGLWNNVGTFTTIVIQPAWWQTTWFRVLLLLTFAGLAYAFYRYRLAQIRHIQTLRDQIARDLHDDVGGVLSGISFYSEAASAMHREGRYQDSYHLLQKIADNARTTIERMSDVVWSMRSDTNNALRLSERLESFGHELLVHRNIRLIIETEPVLEKFTLSPDVIRNLYLIGKEALHNVAKHSGATEVRLMIRQVGGKVSLKVQDNGQGFVRSTSSKGNGLDSMMKRAEAIGATYQLSTQPNGGTDICVER